MSSTNGELGADDPTAGQSQTPIAVQPDVDVVDETKYVYVSLRGAGTGWAVGGEARVPRVMRVYLSAQMLCLCVVELMFPTSPVEVSADPRLGAYSATFR